MVTWSLDIHFYSWKSFHTSLCDRDGVHPGAASGIRLLHTDFLRMSVLLYLHDILGLLLHYWRHCLSTIVVVYLGCYVCFNTV